MFKNLFGKKKKKDSKESDVVPNVPTPTADPINARKSSKESKKSKKDPKPKSKLPPNGAEKAKTIETAAATTTDIEDIGLRHRKKKGKKPNFKKIVPPKMERIEGNVKRSKDKYFPGDVDFRYSSPKEHWVSCFGIGKDKDVDFGDTVRVLSVSAV